MGLRYASQCRYERGLLGVVSRTACCFPASQSATWPTSCRCLKGSKVMAPSDPLVFSPPVWCICSILKARGVDELDMQRSTCSEGFIVLLCIAGLWLPWHPIFRSTFFFLTGDFDAHFQ